MNKTKIGRMVGIAIMSAIVVVLQLLGSFIHFGPASVTLVLIPIVIGAALYGPGAGAFLGGVFSVVVLLQPDTSFFYGMNFFGTVITVVVKGVAAGLLAGLVFRGVSGLNRWLGVVAAAVVCPLVNTGIFFLGCRLFFWNALEETHGNGVLQYILTVFIGINFIAEFLTNVVCAPVIMRILRAAKI